MRKLFLRLSGGLACLGIVPEALAYCTACQVNMFNSPEGRQLIGGLQQGVAFLLAVPVIIAATVGFLLWRAQRQKLRGLLKTSSALEQRWGSDDHSSSWPLLLEIPSGTPGTTPAAQVSESGGC